MKFKFSRAVDKFDQDLRINHSTLGAVVPLAMFLEGLFYTVHQIQEEPEYGEEEEEEEEVDNSDSEVLEEDVLADTFLTMGQQIDILADEVLNL